MDNVLRIGLIGAGSMGLHHARNIHFYTKGADITGVYEPNPKIASSALGILNNASLFNDPLELINSDKIDAVLICSPDSTHAAFVLACLDAKKPVLCEKPLATAVEDLQKILTKESGCGKKYLSVAFNRRFDPFHLAVKKTADSGEIGPPLLWKGVHRNPVALYENGGAFHLNNAAGHDVDSARWLLGSDVKTVRVAGIKSRKEFPANARDLLLVHMEMMNGTFASAELYMNVEYGYEVSTELVCQKGTASTGRADRAIIRSKNNRSVYMSNNFTDYFVEAYLAEITDWIDSARNGRVFSGANAWDGYQAVAVTLAAGAALEEHREVQINAVVKPDIYK